MKSKIFTGLVAGIFLFGFVGMVRAATLTTYSNEASFLAAAGSGLNLLDFEGLGGNTYQTYDSGNGVVFSSSNTTSSALFAAPAGYSPDIISDSLFGNYYGSTLIADFSTGVTAVGSELISWITGSTLSVAVEDELGTIFNYSVVANPAYLGLIATGGEIVNITYSPGAQTVGVDNFYFGQASSVPETSSVYLLAFGMLGLFGLARRKV